MKELFSITEYQDTHFTFHLINNRESVIHLTASSSLHEKARNTLRRILPGATIAKLPDDIFFKDMVRNLVYHPAQPLSIPDFESNPFLAAGTPFQKQIWRLIMKIEPGRTLTYGDLALKAGTPGGARAIGNACHENPLALIIPCHRVIAVNGPGGYAGGIEVKIKLLEIEGGRNLSGEI